MQLKLDIAVISPDRLESVRAALPEPDSCISYVNLVDDVRERRARLRVEIVVGNEMLLDEVVEAVMTAASSDAQSGVRNGNIFVLPIEQWIRIPAGNVHSSEHPSSTVGAVYDCARS